MSYVLAKNMFSAATAPLARDGAINEASQRLEVRALQLSATQ